MPLSLEPKAFFCGAPQLGDSSLCEQSIIIMSSTGCFGNLLNGL
jgi:hypothetical protein